MLCDINCGWAMHSLTMNLLYWSICSAVVLLFCFN
jgi:hypothetical protein